ncbi:putative tRNA sulfurtransferase [Alicyclobacillus cellulosilyticus]|uniref:Probable tRNA sulfurtransferase n=1 Tax=Alicyclobacillus cellulosilyticus TaxID=1003997 RepID=A0A917K3Z4_9BACL|nr:tRNA uracil 4-sulfurtransferase ThiI [Alicyclobacillus cellulosilyticus]GGI97035.1 putative tRNA sulfurtransferase [Alicyclobacillus cellulosilyticus]
MIQHVIARYGEISLKGNNRTEFEKTLQRNMQRALRAWPEVKVERTHGRMLVHLNGAPAEDVMARLARVFGLISLSPVRVVAPDLQAIHEAARALLQDHQRQAGRPGTFKVEVKRVNKQFPLRSPEAAARIGAALLRAGMGWKVNVHEPDVTVYVEIRDVEAFVYGTKVPAVGGLPVGMSGRVGLLLSGGIDSPVAGWLSLKRGVEVEAIHFHSFPFTSERALQKVEDLCQVLANWGGRIHLHTVHFTEVQTAIRKHCPEELGITIMRRMMLRIAERIAAQRGLLALVTGESLGQVASQTLESLRTINAVTCLPVLRPLISEDKVDIIRRAQAIGTYDISILPYEDCCTLFVPRNPRTKPRVEEAEAAERALEVDKLVAEAVERTTMKTFLSAW